MSTDIFPLIVAFLVMLNPFALFIYLMPVINDLSPKDFAKVLFKASIISFLIYALFAVTGNFIFESIFQIHFESFRIFGGIIIFSLAFIFVVGGKKSYLERKEDLDNLASDIALPFMVGAGTISLSILMGDQFSNSMALSSIAIVLVITYAVIIILMVIRRELPNRPRIVFDKSMEMLLRINGFFIGAVGVNMIITGIKNLYL